MTFKKPYHKKQSQQDSTFGNPIQWKNIPHEAPFNPERKFYGIVDFDKAPSLIIEYTCRVRSEAVRLFEEEAHLMGGKLGVISAYK